MATVNLSLLQEITQEITWFYDSFQWLDGQLVSEAIQFSSDLLISLYDLYFYSG